MTAATLLLGRDREQKGPQEEARDERLLQERQGEAHTRWIQEHRLVDERGRITWVNDEGHYHRLGFPAVERPGIKKEWWVNGEQHREGAPAVEWEDGSEEWLREGKRHREGGPAFRDVSGETYWYQNGLC